MTGIQLRKFIFNPLKVNTYLLWDQAGQCIIIDPGCHNTKEESELSGFIGSRGLTPGLVLLTHGHIDHIAGTGYLAKKYGIGVMVHETEHIDPDKNRYDARLNNMNCCTINPCNVKTFAGEQLILFGAIQLKVINTPGHTSGSVLFYEPSQHWLFTGDTLTKGSLGFSSDGYAGLLNCLKREVITLPEDTVFFFGHGPDSSMADELATNVFFRRMTENP